MEDYGFFENLKQGNIGGLGRNLWEGARDEWLGIDDFSRFGRYLGQGDFLKALKSLGAGTLELGGSALMFVPGGQLATLAAKGGKAGKALKFLKPLTLEEQAAARLARAGGARPGLFRGPALADASELLGRTITLPAVASSSTGILSKLRPQLIGMGPGGYTGSFLRGGLGQMSGFLPAEQGLLAKRAFDLRNATPAGQIPAIPIGARIGQALSGKLGAGITRTGIDTQIMSPFMTDVPQEDPYQQALKELLFNNYNSPYAAY